MEALHGASADTLVKEAISSTEATASPMMAAGHKMRPWQAPASLASLVPPSGAPAFEQ
jgi:hypothetical protein